MPPQFTNFAFSRRGGVHPLPITDLLARCRGGACPLPITGGDKPRPYKIIQRVKVFTPLENLNRPRIGRSFTFRKQGVFSNGVKFKVLLFVLAATKPVAAVLVRRVVVAPKGCAQVDGDVVPAPAAQGPG